MRRFSKIAAVVVVGAMALSGCGSSSGGGDAKSSASNDVCKTAKGDGPKVGVAYDVGEYDAATEVNSGRSFGSTRTLWR